MASQRPARPARVRLGAELRRIRKAAGKRINEIPGYSQAQVSLVENGHDAPSWALVTEYVRLGGDRDTLAQLYECARAEAEDLRSARLRGRHAAELPPTEVDADTRHEDVRRHYVLRAREESYAFDAAGVATGVHCRCELEAKDPGVRLFVARYTYDSDPRPDVLRIDAEAGCTHDTTHANPESSMVVGYLRLDRPLDPGGRHALSFDVQVTSVRPARPRIQFRATGGLEHFDLTARFQAPAIPMSLCWFAAPDNLAIESGSARHSLAIEPNGHCHKRFELTAADWYYGFTWTWPRLVRSGATAATR